MIRIRLIWIRIHYSLFDYNRSLSARFSYLFKTHLSRPFTFSQNRFPTDNFYLRLYNTHFIFSIITHILHHLHHPSPKIKPWKLRKMWDWENEKLLQEGLPVCHNDLLNHHVNLQLVVHPVLLNFQISFVTTFRCRGMNYSKALSSMSVVEMWTGMLLFMNHLDLNWRLF